ncbi:MAG: TolC family protein [Sphingomonadales bacterium]|nr:TolC family protein [Sphingomonadales bacterium]
MHLLFKHFHPIFAMVIALEILGLDFHCQETKAQTPGLNKFSLSAAIQYGIDHHTASLNASDDITASKARIREIGSIGLPQLRSSYGLTDNFIIQKVIIPNGRLFNPDAPPGPVALEFQPQYGGNANLTLNQLLFDGSYLIGLKAAQTISQIATKSREMTYAQISENIQKAYYGVLVGQHRVNLLEASMVRLDSGLQEMKIMLDNGLIERLDVQRVELQRNQLVTETAKIGQLRILALQLLKFQMGYPMEDTLVLSDQLEDIPVITNEAMPPVYNDFQSFKARPEAGLLELQIKGNEFEIKNLQAGYLPSVGLQIQRGALAGASKFNQVLNPGVNWFAYGSIGVGVNWSLFDSFNKRYKIQQKRIEKIKNERLLFQFLQSSRLQQDQALIGIRNAIASLKQQIRNQDLSREILNTTRIKYREGVGSNLEVIQAEAGYREAQAAYFNSLYDYYIAKVDYLKASGKLTANNE